MSGFPSTVTSKRNNTLFHFVQQLFQKKLTSLRSSSCCTRGSFFVTMKTAWQKRDGPPTLSAATGEREFCTLLSSAANPLKLIRTVGTCSQNIALFFQYWSSFAKDGQWAAHLFQWACMPKTTPVYMIKSITNMNVQTAFIAVQVVVCVASWQHNLCWNISVLHNQQTWGRPSGRWNLFFHFLPQRCCTISKA